MFASLVGAGVAKLYDLLQSATSSSTGSSDSSFSVPPSSSGPGPAANPSSGALSTSLDQLFLDLQASRGAAGAGASGAHPIQSLAAYSNSQGLSASGKASLIA